MQIVRQGDIMTVKVTGIDVNGLAPIEREAGDVVLAHGEATGHKHRFRRPTTEFYSLWPQDTEPSARIQHARELLAKLPQIDADAVPVGILELSEPDKLVHEEHSEIPHEAGNYLVLRQRTYTPEAIVVVAD